MPEPKSPLFRAWFYFRNGWSLYFAFIFVAINTLVVTYYLAIDKIPFLLDFFPTFSHYMATAVFIGIPVLLIPTQLEELKFGILKKNIVVKF